jgi:hypothetical protein
MRTPAKRWAQKNASGAEFPAVRRAISKRHLFVLRRISKRVMRLDFVSGRPSGEAALQVYFRRTFKNPTTILTFCGD